MWMGARIKLSISHGLKVVANFEIDAGPPSMTFHDRLFDS